MTQRFLRNIWAIGSVFFFVITLNAQSKISSNTGNGQSILFIGNSFTFALGSPVKQFHPSSVTDLNNTNIGGVPALFKTFSAEAGLNLNVSLETSPGKNLDYHLKEKASVIAKSWDYVVMHGYSTLDKENPGNPAAMATSAKEIAALLRSKNPKVDIHLVATWARADELYLKSGFWHDQPIEKMTLDIRKGYDYIATKAAIKDVIPVGEAWNRAIKTGMADANPYNGIEAGKINLWTTDNYHGSSFGYYLEALMDFGSVTGYDPICLGKNEKAAKELGFTSKQTDDLQKIAHDELSARKCYPKLKIFTPKN